MITLTIEALEDAITITDAINAERMDISIKEGANGRYKGMLHCGNESAVVNSGFSVIAPEGDDLKEFQERAGERHCLNFSVNKAEFVKKVRAILKMGDDLFFEIGHDLVAGLEGTSTRIRINLLLEEPEKVSAIIDKTPRFQQLKIQRDVLMDILTSAEHIGSPDFIIRSVIGEECTLTVSNIGRATGSIAKTTYLNGVVCKDAGDDKKELVFPVNAKLLSSVVRLLSAETVQIAIGQSDMFLLAGSVLVSVMFTADPVMQVSCLQAMENMIAGAGETACIHTDARELAGAFALFEGITKVNMAFFEPAVGKLKLCFPGSSTEALLNAEITGSFENVDFVEAQLVPAMRAMHCADADISIRQIKKGTATMQMFVLTNSTDTLEMMSFFTPVAFTPNEKTEEKTEEEAKTETENK